MANISEKKAKSILTGNLISGLKYLITTVPSLKNPFNGGQLDFEDRNSLGIIVRLKVESDVRQYNSARIHHKRCDFVTHRLQKKLREISRGGAPFHQYYYIKTSICMFTTSIFPSLILSNLNVSKNSFKKYNTFINRTTKPAKTS